MLEFQIGMLRSRINASRIVPRASQIFVRIGMIELVSAALYFRSPSHGFEFHPSRGQGSLGILNRFGIRPRLLRGGAQCRLWRALDGYPRRTGSY